MVEQATQSQDGDSKSTLPLHFSVCSLKEVSKFVKTNHYSKTHPGGIDFSFKLEYNGELAGVCLFGYMAGNPKASCVLSGHDDTSKYRELMRLVLLDEVPKNSESQFVGWCLRWLKKNTDLLAVLSFADPVHGHSGGIYRAGNWLYTGLQKPARPRIFVNGIDVHPRMCVNRYGTSSIPKLKALGLTIETLPRESKHRYVYVLRPELTPLLKYPLQPYIKTK
jgi:hypothetical protein